MYALAVSEHQFWVLSRLRRKPLPIGDEHLSFPTFASLERQGLAKRCTVQPCHAVISAGGLLAYSTILAIDAIPRRYICPT